LIKSLINTILNEKKLFNVDASHEISFLVVTSGYYRSYDKGRLVILVFQNSKLLFVMKFYKSNNREIFQEFKIQKLFNSISPDLISKPLYCENIRGFNILIENPINGKIFSRYLSENLEQKSIKNSLTLVSNFYEELNDNFESSSYSELTDEVDVILNEFSKNNTLEKHEINFIHQCKSIFLEYFKNKSISKRYSNNDFIPKNFIISNEKLVLIDFEFIKKTSLYFFEWYQFFKYNSLVSNNFIHHLLISESKNSFFYLALQEFTEYQKNDKFNISCRLIFEIFEFEKQFSVFSQGSKQILKKNFKNLINDLKLRYEHQDKLNELSNLTKTEENIFKIKRDNLIEYKGRNEIDFLKNSIKDKDDIIFGLEKSLQETKSYIENSIKDKDDIIFGLEKSLQETKSYIENSIKDRDEYINKFRKSIFGKVFDLFNKKYDI
jgi:hypothetical protein